MRKILFTLISALLAALVLMSGCGKSLDSYPTYLFEGLKIILPNNFIVVDTDDPIVAHADDYPETTDSIVFTKNAGKDDIKNYTKKNINAGYSVKFDGFTEVTRLEKGTLGKYDTATVTFGINTDGVPMIITQFFVLFDDKTIIITYTSVTGSYDEVFELSIKNVKLSE